MREGGRGGEGRRRVMRGGKGWGSDLMDARLLDECP